MMELEFVPLISDMLESAAYDEERRILVVNFKRNTRYNYLNVPQITFQSLIEAESHGKYFNAYIRNSFPAERVF